MCFKKLTPLFILIFIILQTILLTSCNETNNAIESNKSPLADFIVKDGAEEIVYIPSIYPGPVSTVVYLSESEGIKLTNAINKIPKRIKNEFQTKYTAWKDTWDDPILKVQSNPKEYTKSKQYQAFIKFCKKNKTETLPLLYQNYITGIYPDKQPIYELTLPEKESYCTEVREASQKKSYRSDKTNMMLIIKKLINEL